MSSRYDFPPRLIYAVFRTVLVIIISVSSVIATTRRVPSQYPAIQAAITASSNYDTVLVADGTYTGEGNYNIDFSGRRVKVLSEGGAENCIIDCENQGRGFILNSNEPSSAKLMGFTIINGEIDDYGAGIYLQGADPVIQDCIISNNIAIGDSNDGGGIYGYDAHPQILNCIITGNFTDGNGGGICLENNSDADINNCQITNNTSYRQGGGIYCNNSDPDLLDCNLSNNHSILDGGGLYGYHFSGTLTNCIVNFNHSEYRGGGMYYASTSTPEIERCEICYNWADDRGGGMYIGSTVSNVTNCTICDNLAGEYGGGIYAGSTSSNFTNLIVAHNFGCRGIWFYQSQNVDVVYCCMFDNTMGNFGGDSLYIPDNLGILVGTSINGDSCDAFGNIFIDPELLDHFNANYHLDTGSPCINAGNPFSPHDPDGSIADIGKYWYDPSLVPPRPDIAVSCDNLDFGSVSVGNSLELPFTVYNIGDTALVLRDIYTSNADFYTDFNPADSVILPGDSLTLNVTFEPRIERVYQETLFLSSNATEEPLTVSLQGDGGAVPDSVANLQITLIGADAVLTWDAVTTSVSGYPMTIDCYLIFYETEAYDEYEFLTLSWTNSYAHQYVVQFAASMFYYVEAYAGDLGVLQDILSRGQTLSREEVHQILGRQTLPINELKKD